MSVKSLDLWPGKKKEETDENDLFLNYNHAYIQVLPALLEKERAMFTVHVEELYIINQILVKMYLCLYYIMGQTGINNWMHW